MWNPRQLVVSLAAELYALGCLDEKAAADGCRLRLKYNFTPDATPIMKRSLGVCAIQFSPDDNHPDTLRLLGPPETRSNLCRSRLAAVNHIMQEIGIPEAKELWKQFEGPLIGDARVLLASTPGKSHLYHFEHAIKCDDCMAGSGAGPDFIVEAVPKNLGAMSGDESAMNYAVAQKHFAGALSFAPVLRSLFADYNHLADTPQFCWGQMLTMFNSYTEEVLKKGSTTAAVQAWQDKNPTFEGSCYQFYHDFPGTLEGLYRMGITPSDPLHQADPLHAMKTAQQAIFSFYFSKHGTDRDELKDNLNAFLKGKNFMEDLGADHSLTVDIICNIEKACGSQGNGPCWIRAPFSQCRCGWPRGCDSRAAACCLQRSSWRCTTSRSLCAAPR